jgi:integrase/recombinase XerD
MAITSLDTVLGNFTTYLLARRGLAECTAFGYVATIKRLAPIIGLCPDHQALDGVIVGIRRTGASYSHIVNTSLALERYMEFIGNPIRLGRPKKPRPLVRNTLSEAEISLIIHAAKNARERAILSLLAYSGVRSKELCGLLIENIDFANQVVHVRNGKGQKDRCPCIAGPCIKTLMDYLGERKGKVLERLFVTAVKGNPYRGADLTKLVHVVAKRAGIERRVWPYLFRHSLATNMLHRGAHILAIKEQLGHAFIETTMIYLHSAPERMRMEYRMFAPSYM